MSAILISLKIFKNLGCNETSSQNWELIWQINSAPVYLDLINEMH